MTLFSSLISIFIIIFIGIICAKKQIISKPKIEAIEHLLIKIVIPAYLFIATYTDDLPSLFNIEYISAYLLSFMMVALLTALVFFRKVSMAALYIRMLASGYVNASIYALPVITLLLKDPTSAVMGNLLQVIVIQPIFIVLLTLVKHKDRSIFKKLMNIISSPLLIMPIAGILCNYFQINIATSIVNAVSLIGSGASAIALFTFGLTLGATHIPKAALKADLLGIVFIKNILHPIVALGIAYFMNLESYWYYSLIIAASTPTAFVVYLIAKQFSVEVELLKKVIALSAVVSMVELVLITLMLV